MPAISIVIPNYNGIRFIGQCLDSLRRSSFADYEVIVIDNGSTDGSRELVEQHYAWVRLIALGRNTGFAVACNEGIRASQGDLIALLNNDIEVDEQWIGELVAGMERHPECGMGTSKMLFYDVRDVVYNTGDSFHVAGKGGGRGMGEHDRGQYESEEYVFGACAGAGIYRRSLFDAIGFFDEDFFIFAEDVDLNLRAQYHGFRCIYLPKAVVYHIGTATVGFHSDWHVSLFTRNDLFVLAKNYSLFNYIRYFPRILRARFDLVKTTARAGQGPVVCKALFSFLWCSIRMFYKRYVLCRRVSFSFRPFMAVIQKDE